MKRASVVASLGLLAACAVEGTPLAPIDLDSIEFHVCGPDMGVHPDDSVLVDPDNPFAGLVISDDMKWEIQSAGSTVAAFYSWATINARIPGGESQYYAALNLKAVVDHDLGPASQMPVARELAIRGFQSVLDHFPDAVTYDATGTVAFELATPSFQAIVDLGGTPVGWILVDTPDGPRAIPL